MEWLWTLTMLFLLKKILQEPLQVKVISSYPTTWQKHTHYSERNHISNPKKTNKEREEACFDDSLARERMLSKCGFLGREGRDCETIRACFVVPLFQAFFA